MIVYDIESLVKIYPDQAVLADKNISFHVREGEISAYWAKTARARPP